MESEGIWQIHPFCEGNTRAMAVFIIKFLKTFGFQVSNEVYATTIYLELFFENLLLAKHHDLKNRYLHLKYHFNTGEKMVQSAGELLLLKIIKQEPTITQKELALRVGKSERTIKIRTIELQEKGCIRRLNGKRNGRWEVLVN